MQKNHEFWNFTDYQKKEKSLINLSKQSKPMQIIILQIKIDWSGSMVLLKLEKEIDLFSIEIKLKSQKTDMSTLRFVLILKIWHFYQCTGLDSW